MLSKVDLVIAATILWPLFTSVWDGDKASDDCMVIFKFPKKGALSNCNNWRGTTLLSILSKILAKIIIKRMSDTADIVLRDMQGSGNNGDVPTRPSHSKTS